MCKIEMVEGFTFDYISRSRILKEKKKNVFLCFGFFFHSSIRSKQRLVIFFATPDHLTAHTIDTASSEGFEMEK